VFGTAVGMSLIGVVMRKLGRQSPLVILLAFVLGISAVAVIYFGIIALVIEGGDYLEFGNVC
jgi:hypothetical protein